MLHRQEVHCRAEQGRIGLGRALDIRAEQVTSWATVHSHS